MAFLALAPGVHTIKALMLTDTETRHALTLMYDFDSYTSSPFLLNS